MFTIDNLKEILDNNGAYLDMWEYTSNGFWFTFKFEDVFWNFNSDRVQAIKYDFKLANVEVIAHTWEVLEHDEDEDTYTVLHDMEIML